MYMPPTQYPVWDLFGCLSPHFSVCCLLFSVRSTHSVAPSPWSLQYFWFIVYPFSMVEANQQKDRKGGKASKARPTLLRPLLLLLERKVATAATIGLLQDGTHENRKKEKKKILECFHIGSWVFMNPFPILQARTKLGFPLVLAVHISVCFQVLGCMLSTPRDTSRKRVYLWFCGTLNSGLLPQSSCYCLLFRVFK